MKPIVTDCFSRSFLSLFIPFLFLLLAPQAKAQLYEVPIEEKINNSTLVIEGKVIESQSYFGRAGEIYTAHKVDVNKTLKGSTPPNGSVTITTKGGQVEGLQESWTHQLTLKDGDKGVFFLKESVNPEIENNRFTSPSYDVYSSLQGFLQYRRVKGIKTASEVFHTYSDIEKLHSKIQGQDVTFPPPSGDIEENCLIYSFEPAISNDDSYIAIDIMVRVSMDSLKLYKSSVVMEYDTSFWGTNIVSNSIIIVNNGAISSLSSYNLTTSDSASNILDIAVENTGSISNLYMLTTQKSQLAQIRVPIENLPETIGFEFVYDLMEQRNQYYDPVSGTGKTFRCIDIEDGGLFAPDPDISDFTPKEVAAGVRNLSFNNPAIPGKITIYGSGFGILGVDLDTTDIGNDFRVEFKHADIGPTGNWVSPGVRNDYVFWTDDSIQVYVPSKGEFENDGNISLDNYSGTGTIRVVAGKGFLGIPRTDESDSTLVVRFSVQNGTTTEVMTPPLESIRGKILNFFDGGIPFYYDTIVSTNVRKDVEWAMSEWRCKTGVNFNLHEKADIPSSALPFTCEIIWADLPAGTNTSTGAFVSFNNATTPCFSQADSTATHARMDFNTLLINKNLTWHIGADSIALSGNQHDLRSALLHEFGHCHYIQHSLKESELMYYSPESNSKYFRVITEDACLAGIHVATFSANAEPTINCGGSPVMQTISSGDCEVNFSTDAKDITELNGASIYPSPTNSELTLELKNPFNKPIRVHILNSIGQRMYYTELPRLVSKKEFDVSRLGTGIYYLLIETENNQSYSTKFFKL